MSAKKWLVSFILTVFGLFVPVSYTHLDVYKRQAETAVIS